MNVDPYVVLSLLMTRVNSVPGPIEVLGGSKAKLALEGIGIGLIAGLRKC